MLHRPKKTAAGTLNAFLVDWANFSGYAEFLDSADFSADTCSQASSEVVS
jgi:hypothetical protein